MTGRPLDLLSLSVTSVSAPAGEGPPVPATVLASPALHCSASTLIASGPGAPAQISAIDHFPARALQYEALSVVPQPAAVYLIGVDIKDRGIVCSLQKVIAAGCDRASEVNV